MSRTKYRRIVSVAVSLFFASTASLCLAEPFGHDELGVLVQARWSIGELHSEQNRWQAHIALNSASDVARTVNKFALTKYGLADSLQDDSLAGYFQQRSPHTLLFSLDASGNGMGYLYGLPVMGKFSPVLHAAGTESSTGGSFIANPWVWVGAVAIGVAASSGGGSSGGGSGEGNTTSVVTIPKGPVVGTDDCRLVDTSEGVNEATVIGRECGQ